MKIDRVRIRPFAIPLARPLQTARGAIGERRGFVVELTTDAWTGLGEVSPHPTAKDAVFAECAEELAVLGPALVGAATGEIENELVACMPAPVAMGLDLALRDLEARAAGRTLAEALGGGKSAPPGVAVSGLIEDEAPEEGSDGGLVSGARRLLAAGFRVAKLKASRDPGETIRRVEALGRAAPGLRLRVDVNGAWSRAEALAAARALRDLDLEWLEQPVPPLDVEGMAEVRSLGVRVAADEAIRTAEDVGRLHAARAIDAVVVKFVQVGGLRRAIETAQATEQCGLELSLTTGIDTSIATSALLHLGVALRPGPALGCATLSLLDGDLVRKAPQEGPRMVPVPGAGIGVELEEGSPFLGEEIAT